MKKYIKPTCEVIDVVVEGNILQTSPTSLKHEVGNAANGGAWMAPKRIWESEQD